MATEMQRNHMVARTLRMKKNNNKVVSFSTLILMFTLTWITEKELGRVMKIKETIL